MTRLDRPTLVAAISAAILIVVLIAWDWSGPGGWSRIAGFLLLAALAANVWTLWAALSGRKRGR